MLIDADVFMNELNDAQREFDEYYKGLGRAKTLLLSQPAVDAQPVVHGHWVYDHWCEFKCSNCGEWSNSKPYKGREKYCPNCGAKMDEVGK